MSDARMRLGFSRFTPVVSATLVVFVAMFVASAITVRIDATRSLYGLLTLQPDLVFGKMRLWTLLTYALLHDLGSPQHLLVNCLVLYFFGPAMEARWGSRRFIGFMVLSALAGGLFIMAAFAAGLTVAPVVGASAITMGLIIAWGYTYPDREMLFFFVLPLRGIHLVYLSIAYEVLNALSFSGVSAAAHFGGMLIGFFYGEHSPIRRFYLEVKLKRLRAESEALRSPAAAARPRAGTPPLRVIQGGQQKTPPKDKRYLN